MHLPPAARVLLLLTLASCTKDPASEPAAADGGAPAPAADGGTVPEGGASPAPPSSADPKPDFCTVLTKPLAAQIMGAPVKDAEPRAGDRTSCQYSRDAAGGLEAAQSVEGGYVYYADAAAGRRAFDTAYGHQPSEKPVAGVGDVCFVVVGSVAGVTSTSLHAYQGHYEVEIAAAGASAAAVEEGAKAVFAALPR